MSDSDSDSFYSFNDSGGSDDDYDPSSSCRSDSSDSSEADDADADALDSKNNHPLTLPPVPYVMPSVEVLSMDRPTSMLKEAGNEHQKNVLDSQKKDKPTWAVSPRKHFDLILEAYYAQLKTKPVEEEYVSPFKNVQPQPLPKESPLLKGAKKPLQLPAGYDLSALEVIKNPNHWAIRPGVRTGDRIY